MAKKEMNFPLNTVDLGHLKSIHEGHRAVVTKLLKETDTLLMVMMDDMAELVDQLSVISEQLLRKLDILQALDHEILGICSTEEIEAKVNVSEVVSAKIIHYRKMIDNFLWL